MQEMCNAETRTSLILIKNQFEIEKTGMYSIFIRHGDRDKIPEGEFGNEVELNQKGFRRSLEYGKSMKDQKINRIFTSPVKRCIQTAEVIREGLESNVKIEVSTLLGDPGAFVKDGKLAGDNYLRLGFSSCYEGILNHEPIEGNRDISEGASILSRFFLENAQAEGLNIYVSHDMIVALYAFGTFRRKYTLDSDWVPYLGGLIIKHNNSII